MSFTQFCPLSAHGAMSSDTMPSCVAPPFVRSAAVALPCWIFATRLLLIVVAPGTRHTLASYLSMHTVPDTTESTGQLLSGLAPCAHAVPATTMHAPDTMIPPHVRRITRLLSPPGGVCAHRARARRARLGGADCNGGASDVPGGAERRIPRQRVGSAPSPRAERRVSEGRGCQHDIS